VVVYAYEPIVLASKSYTSATKPTPGRPEEQPIGFMTELPPMAHVGALCVREAPVNRLPAILTIRPRLGRHLTQFMDAMYARL
jgi:hypothetical protein